MRIRMKIIITTMGDDGQDEERNSRDVLQPMKKRYRSKIPAPPCHAVHINTRCVGILVVVADADDDGAVDDENEERW